MDIITQSFGEIGNALIRGSNSTGRALYGDQIRDNIPRVRRSTASLWLRQKRISLRKLNYLIQTRQILLIEG